MNKEYWDYYFSKNKKLTERAFKARISMLIFAMLACVTAMASSAFALFTSELEYQTVLKAGEFDVLYWHPVQQQSDEVNVTHVVFIETTPGVVGYCKIPVHGTDNTTRYYYTEAFEGEMQVAITTAVGCSVGKPEGHWGNPRMYLDPDTPLIGNGALVVHSYGEPAVASVSLDEPAGESIDATPATSPTPATNATVTENTEVTGNTADTTVSETKETPAETTTAPTNTGTAEVTPTPSAAATPSVDAIPATSPTPAPSADTGTSETTSPTVSDNTPAPSVASGSGSSGNGDSGSDTGSSSGTASASSGDTGSGGGSDSGGE